MTGPQRILAPAALVVAIVAIVLVVARGDEPTTLRARFADAGGLVKGSPVRVGGAPVGTVDAIRLTDDNQADVVLAIDDERYRTLRRGTRAAIRAVGLAGVANRFVDLVPGPRDAPALPDGALLPTTQTESIVDLDALLNTFDPRTRTRLQRILREAASVYAGDGAKDANAVVGRLRPAMREGRDLAAELALDPAADERLLLTGAATARALASRRTDLEEGVANAAVALGTIAGERASLTELLDRAPGLLRRTRSTLGGLRGALTDVRPALREARPVAAPLADVVRALPPAGRAASPLLDRIGRLVPSARAALRGLPPLAREGVPALGSTTSTLRRAQPIFEGLRPYSPDVVNGLFGSPGSVAGVYDANGHLLRMQLSVPTNSGIFAPLTRASLGELRATRTGMTARCPGGSAPPAQDGSNPWVPDRSLCDPEHGDR